MFGLHGNSVLSLDCAVNRKRFIDMGGCYIEVKNPDNLQPDENSVLVDAIFGAGLNPSGNGILGKCNSSDKWFVPSGCGNRYAFRFNGRG